MSYNTVFSDAEFSKTSNQLSAYSEYLLQSIKTYRETVKVLMEGGLIAQQINGALTEHLINTTKVASTLNKLPEREVKLSAQMEREVIEADDFSYPEGFLAAVSSFLALFL